MVVLPILRGPAGDPGGSSEVVVEDSTGTLDAGGLVVLGIEGLGSVVTVDVSGAGAGVGVDVTGIVFGVIGLGRVVVVEVKGAGVGKVVVEPTAVGVGFVGVGKVTVEEEASVVLDRGAGTVDGVGVGLGFGAGVGAEEAVLDEDDKDDDDSVLVRDPDEAVLLTSRAGDGFVTVGVDVDLVEGVGDLRVVDGADDFKSVDGEETDFDEVEVEEGFFSSPLRLELKSDVAFDVEGFDSELFSSFLLFSSLLFSSLPSKLDKLVLSLFF